MARQGRPPKFTDVDELEVLIEAYYQRCIDLDRPMTIEGLALALDIDRKTLTNYGNKEDFFPTINKARQYVSADMSERALKGDYNPAISIFLMKNNFGYKDKQEVEQETKSTSTVINIVEDKNESV